MIKFAHFLISLFCLGISGFVIDTEPERAIYDVLMAILNILIAMFWQRD